MDNQSFEATVQKVPRTQQLKSGENIRFSGNTPSADSLRVMFLGNSITLHGSAPHIGWYGDWGMAASSKEKDYVHLVMDAVWRKHPDAAWCIVQGSIWETNLADCDYEKNFSAARDFHPHVIISSLETNIPESTFDAAVFSAELRRLHQYLSCPDGSTRIIIASSYCNIPKKDAAIRAYAEASNASYVHIGDIRENQENLAMGLFEHEGVAGHPGDLGMRRLAERYVEALRGVSLL